VERRLSGCRPGAGAPSTAAAPGLPGVGVWNGVLVVGVVPGTLLGPEGSAVGRLPSGVGCPVVRRGVVCCWCGSGPRRTAAFRVFPGWCCGGWGRVPPVA
jgi:hypothetical protein